VVAGEFMGVSAKSIIMMDRTKGVLLVVNERPGVPRYR
jgi:hypothetical protein